MPNKNRQELYNLFTTGNKPTQDDFADLIDSTINILDDGVGVAERGEPLELVQQGTKQRFLDFSSAKDSPVWRISAQSEKASNGLNLATPDEKSRLFIRKDNGYIGINNGDPKAKLHIRPDEGSTLQVDDLAGHPLLQIEADGTVGICTEPQESFTVSVGGNVNFKDNASLNGSLSVNSGVIMNNGAVVETGNLEAKNGLTVNGGAVIETGKLEVEKGLTVSGGITVETGNLEAKNGLAVDGGVVIRNGQLEARAGLTVQGATTIENGVLSARGGISVPDGSMLSVGGPVLLGKETDGPVTVNGELTAKNGVVVTGAALVAMNGVNVTGDLNAPNNSTLGNAVIDNLNVNDINIMGNIALQAVNLSSLKADSAEINSMTTGKAEILGSCQTADHVVFNSGKIYLSYVGPTSSKPKLKIVKGTITGEPGHFEFMVDANKVFTVIYDDSADVDNFLSDWESYQADHSSQTEGFYLLNAGARTWDLQEQELDFVSTGTYKEYVLNEYGLSVMHTDPTTETPSFEISAKEDVEREGFDFLVEGKKLIIKYPVSEEIRTVEQLFLDWQTWYSDQLDAAGNFELRKTPEFFGEALVSDQVNTVLSVNVAGAVFSKVIMKTNTVTVNGHLKFGGSEVRLGGVSKDEGLAENSDTLLSTQKAVKTYIDAGMALKADQLFVATELGKKADRSFVVAELVKKADLTHVDAELAEKADRNYVVEELDNKADQIFVTTELAKKANQDAVTAELAKKADQVELSQVTEELQNKADRSTMLAALATKVNLAKIENISVGPGATITVDGIGLTADYSGLLQVMIAAADHVGAGLFALDGTESLIKIAGDGLSDQQDNPDTCNAYLHEGKVMLQNALTDEITAKVLYFGT